MGNLSLEIKGETAIVTGGGTGIGKAISLGLAACGVDVVITSRNREHLEGTAREIEKMGRKCLSIPADVRVPEDVDRVVAETLDKLGTIDILVNNSGASFASPLIDISPNGWNAIIGINLTGTYLFCRAVGKHMVSRKTGNIVNISALAGRNGVPLMAHYGAAKAGVINLTNSIAAEWGKFNVRVNCVAPGPIVTEAMVTMMGYKSAQEAYEKWGTNTSLGHPGSPEDIASAVLFLVSEGARFITGATLHIDGQVLPHQI